MSQIKASISAHSLSPFGGELITYVVTFPRIILPEVLTHRMLSKSTSSSRSVPFNKMLEVIENNPFIPNAWQKHHKGMQGTEYWTSEDIMFPLESLGNTKDNVKATTHLRNEWLAARDAAILSAKHMHSMGLTKQLCNRLLEPWMWTTMIITTSKEGLENFFNLRNPRYQNTMYLGENAPVFKSKKEFLNHYEEFGNLDDLQWFKINKSQAEIHMQALAEAMYDAYNESTPKLLSPNEWHIPFRDRINSITVTDMTFHNEDLGVFKSVSEMLEVKFATAMAAHVSYTVINEEKNLTPQKLLEIYNKLVSSDPLHASPLEHCAKCMTGYEYETFIKGQIHLDANSSIVETSNNCFGWCNNFHGFISYRYLIENNLKM